MALYAVLPTKLRTRLLFTLSALHQLFNLCFGRLLPELPFPDVNLTGKTAIVTGANSGIGFQLALSLARLGANVTLAVRSEAKGRNAVHDILSQIPDAKGRVQCSILDISSQDSVRTFASTWATAQGNSSSPIDILCHNAGITYPPQQLTPEGIETIYATNFLGSFLLTHLLERHLTPNARVVFTSSSGQLNASFTPEFSTSAIRGTSEPGFHAACHTVPLIGWRYWSTGATPKYAQTKAMQCAFARLLQRRWDSNQSQSIKSDDVDSEQEEAVGVLDGGRKTAHAFTPAFTMTPIFGKFQTGRSFLLDLLKDPIFALLAATTVLATHVSQGAMTGLWLASAPAEKLEKHDTFRNGGGGGFWDRMRRQVSIADVMSEKFLARLWKRWEADAGVDWR